MGIICRKCLIRSAQVKGAGFVLVFPPSLWENALGVLFAITLGIYSIVPSIYLWREVSRPLSCMLFVFFVLVGWVCGLVF